MGPSLTTALLIWPPPYFGHLFWTLRKCLFSHFRNLRAPLIHPTTPPFDTSDVNTFLWPRGARICRVPLQLHISCLPQKNSYLNPSLVIGGKLVYLYTKKQGKVPKCGDCKAKLQGVSRYIFLDSFQLSILGMLQPDVTYISEPMKQVKIHTDKQKDTALKWLLVNCQKMRILTFPLQL